PCRRVCASATGQERVAPRCRIVLAALRAARTDRSHPVSVRTVAHTRLVLQPQCAEGQNRTRTRPDPCERVPTPPDRTHPMEVGFDDFWQMTGGMGSSTAHSYGRRSRPPGAHG